VFATITYVWPALTGTEKTAVTKELP
jgi:hypothetical protein